MRLNPGCGNNKIEGYLNVDSQESCAPDQVVDLETFPWPFGDNSVDEIIMSHVLEHLGETMEIYLSIITELYRICQPDAEINITVLHPRHDDFVTDQPMSGRFCRSSFICCQNALTWNGGTKALPTRHLPIISTWILRLKIFSGCRLMIWWKACRKAR